MQKKTFTFKRCQIKKKDNRQLEADVLRATQRQKVVDVSNWSKPEGETIAFQQEKKKKKKQNTTHRSWKAAISGWWHLPLCPFESAGADAG